ncbi:MAG TPA: cysteine rich repeat-containing protein [Acetobacteraceae bacterium]
MRPALLALLTGLVLCQATATNAQQPTQAQANAIRQSCRGDYEAHCASVPTGGNASLLCLRENMASLSPACQSAVGATEGGTAAPAAGAAAPSAAPMGPREQTMTMRRACGGDFRRYCQGVALGGGRALGCLADHRESLSPPCREALASARGR